MAVDFVGNMTRDPKVFLSRNICRFLGTVTEDPSYNQEFMIYASDGEKSRYVVGPAKFNLKGTGGQYILKKYNAAFGKGAEMFKGVWSGYKGGTDKYCQLPVSGGPDIMLTPPLSGCAIVWGVNADGSAEFGHYNFKNGGETEAGSVMADKAADHFAGKDFGIMTKEHYYNKAKGAGKKTGANAIGVRRGGRWSLFVQYVEDKASGSQIRGVEELPTTSTHHLNLERY